MAAPPPPLQAEQKTSISSNPLPRSVTWRLHLGLLKSPPGQHSGGPIDLLQDVFHHNTVLIREEQSHYEKLQAAYGDHLTKATTKNNEENDNSEREDEEEEAVGGEINGQQQQQLRNPSSQDSADPLGASLGLDPLTAMLQEQQAQEDRRQELDLKYRKEKARRKRGLATEAKVVVADCDEGETEKKLDADTLGIVDKDLHRLPSPDISDFDGESVQWETEEQREKWIEALREILYIFGQEHPHIGYRQGMHEVASYIWMAMEIDRKIMHRKEEGAAVKNQLQEQSTILFGRAAAYAMLRSILVNVRLAFDVKVASNSKPLEDMSHSILAKIKQSHNYHGLQDHLTPLLLSLSVPPQLYCTKWIRLLFSREVVGAQNVIVLWDIFIELVAEGWEWMAILETTAASRILLVRDQLLDTSMPDYSQAAHHHHAMDLLMNMPPMDDIKLLVSRLKGLLELQKYTQCMHQEVTKQDEAANNPNNNNHNSLYPQAMPMNQQHRQPSNGGFPTFGDAADISSVFSLKSLRQSLEQGRQQFSFSSDTFKKKLVDEWNGLTNQPAVPPQDFQQQQTPQQRSYMVDTAMFGDEDELQHHQPERQPGPVPDGYPQPVHSMMNPQNQSNGMTYQQQTGHPRKPQRQPQQQAQQTRPPHHLQRQQHQQQQNQVHPQPAQSPTFGAPMSNGMVQNPLMGPSSNNVARSAAAAGQSPHELAYRLGNSVAALQDFVMSVARPNNQNPSPNVLPAGVPARVPNTVWEALAEVEAVRNVLLQQNGQNRFK